MNKIKWDGVARRIFVAAVVLTGPTLANAQVLNNWTNMTSARWEDPYWSLGVLPDATQSVSVTNNGFKAVAVSSSTVENYSSSVTVSNLALAAPEGALSSLLLDYAGLNTPFKVLGGCRIGTNGLLQNLYSSFEVDGANGSGLDLFGGNFSQEGGQTSATVPISLRNATVALTNGNMTLGTLILGDYASSDPGDMIQNGGNVAVQYFEIDLGSYNLYAGTLYSLNATMAVNSGGSTFYQGGGTNYGNVSLGDGATYTLDAGLCQGNFLSSGGFSRFTQNGGLVEMDSVNVVGPGDVITIDDPLGFYLRGGETHCGTLNIADNGVVEMDAGHFILTNTFNLHGMYFDVGDVGPVVENAYFMLVGGVLSSPSITVGPYAAFNQRSGTNDIAGGLTIIDSEFYVTGGTLQNTYIGIGVGAYFEQLGGSTYVNGVLSDSGTYALPGGFVRVNGLFLSGLLDVGTADFANSGLVDFGGKLRAGSFVQPGQVRLSTNGVVELTTGSAQVHFQNSSSISWSPGVFLVITNWHNAGANSVYFGADARGLSTSQLAQVRFVNPSGFAPGYYAAQITSDGEIVPVPRPELQTAISGGALVLSWSGEAQLLSAPAAAGPYQPVSGAISPYAVDTTAAPQQFFKLTPPAR